MSNDTPERILDEAWALARRRGLAAVTMGEIAKVAGVSRQLMYFHFANRAGLLVAMTRRQDTRSGFRERAWHDRMDELREAFRFATGRLTLAPGWTADTAADWVWARLTECLVHIERRLGLSLVRRTYPHRTPPPETLEPGSLP